MPDEIKEVAEKEVVSFTQEQVDAQVLGLKTALASERQTAKGAKAWDGLGLTIEEVQAMQAEKVKAAEDAAKASGDFDSILAQKQTGWDTDRAALTAERDGSRAALQTYVAGAALSSELAQGKAKPEGIEAIPKLFANRIQVEFADGKPVMNIMMADGVTPMAGSAADGKATMADLTAEAQKTYPSLFNTEMLAGGGMQPNIGGAGGGSPNAANTTHADKIAGFTGLPVR